MQAKDVPDEVHRTLKARAALSGLSLNEYLSRELVRLAGRPSPEELLRQLHDVPPADLTESPVTTLRRMRDR